MLGYWGRILRIDLTQRKSWIQEFDENWARSWIGGRGFASALLWDELNVDTNWLGPENRLIFVGGPVTGAPVAGSGRCQVMGRSPLTGGYGESSAGGGFGPQMKYAGYDSIVIAGASEEPVYLWIHDSDVQFCDAAHLWGKVTGEAQNRILVEVGDSKAIVAAIGPAGERMCPIASVIGEKHRAWARTGLGALMGSKNLKAVVIRGTGKPPVADSNALRRIAKSIAKLTMGGARGRAVREYGTALGLESHQTLGILPTQNFRRGVFEGASRLSAERMAETILVGRYACPFCPIGCGREVSVRGGPRGAVSQEYGGPEYETLAAFGSNCMVDDLEAVALASQLCNMYGVDTISAGNVIGWAMECYERGVFSQSDLDGLDLRWGNAEAMLEMLRKICLGEGIGALLSLGVLCASKETGKDSSDFAVQVKGLEAPFHEPRGKVGMALMYATSPRGAVHTGYAHDTDFETGNSMPELGIVEKLSRFSTKDKPRLMKITNDACIALELLGTCAIVYSPIRSPIRVDTGLEVLRAVTGWDMSLDEFLRVGERANNMARAFNVRVGMTRSSDTMPKRFSEPLIDGPAAGSKISQFEFERMLDEYYRARGWDGNGVPTAAKLREVGISEVSSAFYGTHRGTS